MGIEGPLADGGDHGLLELHAQLRENVGQELLGDGTRPRQAPQRRGDRGRLREADGDAQLPLPTVSLPEHQDRIRAGQVDDDTDDRYRAQGTTYR